MYSIINQYSIIINNILIINI